MMIIKRISAEYPNLSKVQRKIADYIFANLEEVSWRSAAHIAQCIGISESSIIRFVSTFGYDGYKQMQRDLQKEVESKLSLTQRFQNFVQSDPNSGSLIDSIYKLDLENLAETYKSVTNEMIEAAADYILSARRIGIAATRVSVGPAVVLQMLLNQLLENVSLLIPGFDSSFDMLRNWDEQDLIIAISSMKWKTFTCNVCHFAKEKGCKIISICDSHRNVAASLSDITFQACIDGADISLTATIFIINVLLQAVSNRDPERFTAKRAEMDSIFERFVKITYKA